MLCVKLKSYTQPCAATTGGVANVWFYDPSDFNFTQAAAAADGTPSQYSALALRVGATAEGGGKLFPVKFERKKGKFTAKQTVTGCSVKWDYEFSLQLPNISHDLNTFLMSLDVAGCCCGLGVIFRLNSGKIFVAGERFVNDEEIPYFELKQDGSELDSGEAFGDFNGAKLMIKDEYSRPPFEFSGGMGAIEGFQ